MFSLFLEGERLRKKVFKPLHPAVGQRTKGGKKRQKERKERGTTAVMFYEMILFCSLAGVVGTIISLAETNAEKARILQGRGVPAPRVPHCHLAAQALASPNAWGSASSQPHLPVPVHAAGTYVKMG